MLDVYINVNVDSKLVPEMNISMNFIIHRYTSLEQ